MAHSIVERYKEIAGRNSEAVERMRVHDRERVQQLKQELERVDRDLEQASERERVAKLAVRLHWEAAVEALWSERWLAGQPMPQAATMAEDIDPLVADSEVERTYEALREALRKPSVLPRRGRE